MDTPTEAEIADAIAPKSDQINADDLAGGRTMDVQIAAVKSYRDDKGNARIACRLEGHDRVFRPCKSMARVLVACWGKDARAWAGRWLRLYTDPDVQFGGVRTGGLRISHATLDRPVTMALTERRGLRREWTIQPLRNPEPHRPAPETAPDLDAVLADLGLTVADVDRWLVSLTPPRGPVAQMDESKRRDLAAWLAAGGPARAATVRDAGTAQDAPAAPAPEDVDAADRAAIEAEERAAYEAEQAGLGV